MDELYYYSATIITILSLKLIFKKYNVNNPFNYINIIFYTLWTLVSWFITYKNLFCDQEKYIIQFSHFLVHTINCNYIYELIFNRPDLPHTIHHVLTITLQSFAYYTGFLNISTNLQLCNTSHSGYFSSILSNMRSIYLKNNWKNKNIIVRLYYYSYLISKIGGILLYYYILFMYRIEILRYPNIIVLGLYFLVHAVQSYFSIIIMKKLKNN